MEGKISFISPQDFLDEFVPKARQRLPARFATLLKEVPTTDTEKRMYEPLMNALNDKKVKLCPRFTFVATPSRGDKSAEHKQAVDCGLYPAKFAPPPRVNDDGNLTSPAVDWSRIQVSIEVKPNQTQDPFHLWSKDGKPSSLERKQILGQILDYAKSVFDHQHRMFQYMVFIAGEDARILRIDRSGVFVTDAIKFKTNGLPLLEFFWRFARLNDEGRGEDPTARRILPNSNEARDIRCRLRDAPEGYVSDLFRVSYDADWPWYVLTLKDERTGTQRRFFVGKPHFESPGLAGRGTRGYVALDLDDDGTTFFYLKDSWRVVHDEIRKEGLVLETLNANKVPHVPTLECHGDLGQRTKSYDIWYRYHPEVSRDTPCPLKSHAHYRLVVKEVCKPLKEFRTGFELVFALLCCLKAHRTAYNLGIIHRDISAGNILLYPGPNDTWTGMLNDWELSKAVHSGSPVGRQPDRTGTWQFLSARALNNCEKLIVIQDELESVLHVLVYMAIRFLPHNCPTVSVGKLLYDYFDEYQDMVEGYGCGLLKLTSIKTGKITFVLNGEEVALKFNMSEKQPDVRHPIDELVETLFSWFKAYYAVTQPVEAKRSTNAQASAPPASKFQQYRDMLSTDFVPLNPSAPVIPVKPDIAEDRTADLKIAEMLETHDAMIQLFVDSLNADNPGWPTDDVGEDKKPKNGYKPGDEHPQAATSFMSQSVKRAAEDVEDSELEPPSTPKRYKPADDEEPTTPVPLAGSPSPDTTQ